MLTGLQKFAAHQVRERASSPKLQVLNTAPINAQSRLSFDEARKDRELWGRLAESAIGAHLINSAAGTGVELFYWRERGREVDFVLRSGKTVVVIEVKLPAHRTGYSAGGFHKPDKPPKERSHGRRNHGEKTMSTLLKDYGYCMEKNILKAKVKMPFIFISKGRRDMRILSKLSSSRTLIWALPCVILICRQESLDLQEIGMSTILKSNHPVWNI